MRKKKNKQPQQKLISNVTEAPPCHRNPDRRWHVCQAFKTYFVFGTIAPFEFKSHIRFHVS